MKSSLVTAAAILLTSPLSTPLAAAEILKLRHTATIYADAGDVPLRVPQGVGCGPGDTFLVADSGNGRVLRVQLSGTLAQVTGIVKLPEIPYPIRVDGGSDGSMVVLDGRRRALARVRSDGSFGGWIDVPRPEEGPAPVVRSFALGPGDALVVADVAAGRVVQLTTSGVLERVIDLPGEARGLSDVAVDARGSIFALDGVGRKVWVARSGESAFAPLSGSLSEDLDFPGAIDADAAGRLMVTDLAGGGVVILGPDGSFRGRQSAFGWKEGFLRYPADLCWSRRGLVVIADRENQRVQVFAVGE